MNKRAGIAVPFLIVFLLIVLALSGMNFYLLLQERQEKLALKAELGDVEANYKKASFELDDSKKQVAVITNQLNNANERVELLTQELEDEESVRQEAFANIEQLKQELDEEKSLSSQLQAKLSKTQAEALNAQERIKELVGQKNELETKVKELKTQKEQVELGKIVVNQEIPAEQAQNQPKEAMQPAKTAAGVKEGKVLVVNKDYNFVVINLGSRDKVAAGDIFSIYHNNKYVGDVKVEKIHDSMAAAGFLFENIKNNVNEGDRVVLKVK